MPLLKIISIYPCGVLSDVVKLIKLILVSYCVWASLQSKTRWRIRTQVRSETTMVFIICWFFPIPFFWEIWYIVLKEKVMIEFSWRVLLKQKINGCHLLFLTVNCPLSPLPAANPPPPQKKMVLKIHLLQTWKGCHCHSCCIQAACSRRLRKTQICLRNIQSLGPLGGVHMKWPMFTWPSSDHRSTSSGCARVSGTAERSNVQHFPRGR